MVLWDLVANEVAVEFPDVKVEKMLVDAMTTRMVLKPESIDTIVATNLVSATLFERERNQLITENSMQIYFLISLRR
jgi:isocitrate/isopropylmalate dehydrogenase